MFKVPDDISAKITNYLGSWKFMGHYTIAMVVWCVVNTVLAHVPTLSFLSIDQWPFQALNLVLGIVASMTGPIVMISQSKADAKRDALLEKISRIEDTILKSQMEEVELNKEIVEELKEKVI